ncbi:MAG: GNAT family N-acetyltransferase [FCB group bacterium]|nr:GNAT family N-acetyltransferase [FCB group bacterium]
MTDQTTLETERLILRRFNLKDAPRVQLLAGDKAIAETTLNIPHPYEDGMAEEWIGTHEDQRNAGKLENFAIVQKEDNNLVGAIGLVIKREFESAEMGYWVGKPYWGKGYCTEAARAVLKYGFEQLELNRIHAHYMVSNSASAKVMEKIGMQYEGHLRQAIKKWGKFHDYKAYSILKSEYVQKS